jgi:hypothetical protein
MILKRFRFSIAAAFAVCGMAQTTATVTRQSSFPPVGLASTETAQINVVNLASASTSGTAASCTGTVSFVNANGATIGTASPFTVASGQIFSVTLPFSAAGASSSRTEFRGVVALTYTRGSGVPCALASSLETYDASTGATHVFMRDGGGSQIGGLGPR